jgi:hypothetical protein
MIYLVPETKQKISLKGSCSESRLKTFIANDAGTEWTFGKLFLAMYPDILEVGMYVQSEKVILCR